MQCTNATHSEIVTTPFRYDDQGHILVKILINGVEIEGIFDTGSARSAITAEQMERVNLEYSNKTSDAIYSYYSDKTHNVHSSVKTSFFVNRLESPKRIIFSQTPENFNFTIWGNNIIHQFNWLFDFNSMALKISKNSIPFDKNDCVKIHYKTTRDGYILCSLYLPDNIYLEDNNGNILQHKVKIDDICIDSGRGGILLLDSIYTSYLTIYNNLSSQKLIKNGTQLINCTILPKDINTKLTFIPINKDKTLEYNDPIYFNHTDRPEKNIKGLLSLGYNASYSKIYFDSVNSIIYLKK